jgi:hypothetical protein
MEDRLSHWTFRDIFLSFGLALDPILLAIGYLGLLLGGAAYGFLYFLGSATGDAGARGTFSLLGGVIFVAVWVITSGILARVVATQLLEARKPRVQEIWSYFLQRVRVLLLIPASFAGVVLATLGAMGMLELLGRLPGLGPILFGISFTLVFLLGLTAVLAFALHTLAGLLYPTILAVRSGGVLGTVREILSLARVKPASLLIYSLVILAVGTLVTLLILSLVWATLALVTSSAENLMGEDFEAVLAGLPSIFHPFVSLLGIGAHPGVGDVAWHYDLGGLLVGVSLLSIFAATAAYPAVMIGAAGSIAYFILTEEPLPAELPLPGAARATAPDDDLDAYDDLEDPEPPPGPATGAAPEELDPDEVL